MGPVRQRLKERASSLTLKEMHQSGTKRQTGSWNEPPNLRSQKHRLKAEGRETENQEMLKEEGKAQEPGGRRLGQMDAVVQG